MIFRLDEQELEEEGKYIESKLINNELNPKLIASEPTKNSDLLNGLNLDEYRIGGTNEDWEKALKDVYSFFRFMLMCLQVKNPTLISVNAADKKRTVNVDFDEEKSAKKRKKDKHHSKGKKH